MKIFNRSALLAIPIFLGASSSAWAVQQNTFAISAVAVQTAPKLDGTLDDPAWKNAAHVQLDWDFSFQRPADESTDAYLLIDGKYVYVAFAAKQHEPIVATQHTNDQPLPSDDVVRVYFWPAGDAGNEYGFVATPAGTHYAFSSENTAFSPNWEAVAKSTGDGYVVTERIPIDVMRGDGRSVWRVQFDRRIRSSNQMLEWAHAQAQSNTDSSVYSGYLNDMGIAARSARTKPRIAVYGLGELAAPSAGGSTSRMGADVALPVTQTSSFVATFHPDYSNVELDQQSISPTAFPRRYDEVRPFFTQGANYYNDFDCNDCWNYPLLYTPAIPTPRSGYALEGTQGHLTFGGFDAIGDHRSDTAQSVFWKSSDRRYQALYQRESVDFPGAHDVAEYYQGIAGNYHNFNAYATVGNESGTQITQTGAGRFAEYGLNFYTPKSGLYAAYHDVGNQYAPYDAFTQINDIKGPSVYMYREFNNGPHSYIQSLEPSFDYASFTDSSGAKNYAYDSLFFSVATRTQWFLLLTTGSTYLRLPGTPGGYSNQNGFSLKYGANTSTPSGITYNAGVYGAGFLHSTDLFTSLHVMRLGTLSLEAYNTNQLLDAGGRYTQWLERASFAYQLGPGESLALGWRKIIGTGPVFFTAPEFTDATNLSFAYYRRIRGAEIYLAYGTPNELNTQHDLLLKIIRYFGADKGT